MRYSWTASLGIVVGTLLTVLTVESIHPTGETLGAQLGSRVLAPPAAGIFDEEFEICLRQRDIILGEDAQAQSDSTVDAWSLSPLEFARRYGFGIMVEPDEPAQPEHQFVAIDGRQLEHAESVRHSESCAVQVSERIEREDSILERELGPELAAATERVEQFVSASSAEWTECIEQSGGVPFAIAGPDDIEVDVLPFFMEMKSNSDQLDSDELERAAELEAHVATVLQDCWQPIQAAVELLRADVERELIRDGENVLADIAAEIHSVWSRDYSLEDANG